MYETIRRIQDEKQAKQSELAIMTTVTSHNYPY
jgi:hypothetical protein